MRRWNWFLTLPVPLPLGLPLPLPLPFVPFNQIQHQGRQKSIVLSDTTLAKRSSVVDEVNRWKKEGYLLSCFQTSQTEPIRQSVLAERSQTCHSALDQSALDHRFIPPKPKAVMVYDERAWAINPVVPSSVQHNTKVRRCLALSLDIPRAFPRSPRLYASGPFAAPKSHVVALWRCGWDPGTRGLRWLSLLHGRHPVGVGPGVGLAGREEAREVLWDPWG